jgi:hypothetical protein
MKATKNRDIPNGVAHLELLDLGAALALREGQTAIREKEKTNLQFIGVCLCVLYQAATCHRKCHGGAHVLESLCGRAYNLAASAIHLSKLGYYDEALNLIRGIGEISNLVALSSVEEGAIQEWLTADDKTRRNKFSPARVRERVRKNSVVPMIADGDWYSDLCEKYTHVTPKTKPNFHNQERPMCGGHFQLNGLDEALGQLATILGFLSMFVCKYFKFDDLFGEIKALLRGEDDLKMSESV